MARYTKWRVFKVKHGDWAGRWCASNYSLADGFRYDQRPFDSHPEALAYALGKLT